MHCQHRNRYREGQHVNKSSQRAAISGGNDCDLNTVFSRWHDLTLEIDYPKTELALKLDNERFTSSEWSNTDSEVSFREIYFGGYRTEGKRQARLGHSSPAL